MMQQPWRKRLLQAFGLVLMIAGALSLLEMAFVSVDFGPSGPPTLYIAWPWVRLIGAVLALWGGKRMMSRGMAPVAAPVAPVETPTAIKEVRLGLALRLVKPQWIKGSADDPADLCSHGHIDFRLGEDVLVDPERDLEVTTSAAALYLLRTLDSPHTKEKPVGDQLFPCCGFNMYAVAGSPDVVSVGCPNGADFEVLHEAAGTQVVIRAKDGRQWRVPMSEWKAAVFAFSDQVSRFFAASSPKRPSDVDADGFRAFLAEWERRRGEPLGGGGQ